MGFLSFSLCKFPPPPATCKLFQRLLYLHFIAFNGVQIFLVRIAEYIKGMPIYIKKNICVHTVGLHEAEKEGLLVAQMVMRVDIRVYKHDIPWQVV